MAKREADVSTAFGNLIQLGCELRVPEETDMLWQLLQTALAIGYNDGYESLFDHHDDIITSVRNSLRAVDAKLRDLLGMLPAETRQLDLCKEIQNNVAGILAGSLDCPIPE